MFRLKNGSLSMDDVDLEHIQGLIDEENVSPIKVLEDELRMSGLDIKDVHDIELQCCQMKNKRWCNIYSQIVCAFWNEK